MKKLAPILFTLLSLSPLFSQAQESKFEAGVLGGPSLRYMDLGYGKSIGGSAGFQFQYNFHKIFSVNTAIFYELKGEKNNSYLISDPWGQPSGAEVYTNVHTLMFPIVLKANFGDKHKFSLMTGPNVFFNLSSKYNAYLMGNLNPSYSGKFNNFFNPVQVGWTAGMGIKIKLSDKFSLPLETRFNANFSSSVKSDQESDRLYRFHTFQFLTGLTYHFNGKK
jgi:opacity protein-like surface antigen